MTLLSQRHMITAVFRRARLALAQKRVLRRCDAAIDPTARVNYRNIAGRPPGVLRIGHGSIVEGAIIGERPNAEIVIGANTFIGNSALISAARIEIGDDVLISWGCTIVDHLSHSTLWCERAEDVRRWYRGEKDWTNVKIAPVRIGNKVWIGFNTIILAGINVGEGAVIGCGSIVTRDVPPYTIVAGNPARIIREISHEE